MSRVCVAKTVRMNRPLAGRQNRVECHQAAHLTVAKSRAFPIHKERRGEFASYADALPAASQVLLDRFQSRFGQWHLSLLVAFAANLEPAFLEIEVVDIRPHQLADADSTAIEQLQNGEVALTRGQGLGLPRLDAIQNILGLLF